MIELMMLLQSLPPDGVPQLPMGGVFRAFGRHGDAERWHALQDGTGVYGSLPTSLFIREFGRDAGAHGERIVFADVAEESVGVSAAWHGDGVPPTCGRIHWVAVEPAWQRRGVGRALVLQSLHRLAELGCTSAYLTTGSENHPAIRLYATLGFEPSPRNEVERRAWQDTGVARE